jgi:putative membrane protein
MRMNPVLKTLLSIAAASAMLGAATVGAQTAPATGQRPAGGGQAAPATGQAPAATGGAATTGAALSKGDQKILMDMAAGNMAEIEIAKLADSKSQNDQVKTYARQMIDDHTKALTEIQQLASTRAVTLPTALDKQHQAMADKLGALSGDAFDKAYMRQAGVDDHKKMHGMLNTAQKKAKDPDIKALVTRIQPTVEQHLKAAQQMKPGKAADAKGKAPAATGASTS